jgi:hypothetical protein
MKGNEELKGKWCVYEYLMFTDYIILFANVVAGIRQRIKIPFVNEEKISYGT